MYFPQSQIKTNLYSNGDFVIKSTNKLYTGFYWKTSKGDLFTGKNPNDKPIQELGLITKNLIHTDDIETTNTIGSTIYQNLKGDKSNKIVPFYSPELPSVDDYKLGEFRRYFCKKTNDLIYIEINKDIHDKLSKQDKTYLWELYFPFNLAWTISGDISKVYTVNRNVVNLVSYRKNLTKFDQYLNNDFLKFYKTN